MTLKSYNPWWEQDSYAVNDHLSEIFPREDAPLVLKALRDRTCLVSGSRKGKANLKIEDAIERLRTLGIVPYSIYGGAYRMAGTGEYLSFSQFGGTTSVDWTASSEEMGEKIRLLVDQWIELVPETKKVPPVYGFSFEHGSYMVREIGTLGDTFIEGNYDHEVVEGYRRVVSELTKEDPRGRLVLVEGNPGTGKTRMVRALIGDLVNHSKCIVVPPSLMDRLAGPEFTMCLIHQRVQGTPITLILEDADDCLIARQKNTAAKASLAALLNLSDGIMGATLNLRVVATTNQELGGIDEAILRPGRLLERIHVGPLWKTQAERVFARETNGGEHHYGSPTTLAQVYSDAYKFMEKKTRGE